MRPILIASLLFALTGNAQDLTVEQIDSVMQAVNTDTTLIGTEYLGSEAGYSENFCQGAGVTVYMAGNQVCKIVERLGMSYGPLITEIYILNGEPIFIIEREMHYGWNQHSMRFDFDLSLEMVFESIIYVNNWEGMEARTTGERQLSEGVCSVDGYSWTIENALKLATE